MPVTMKNLAVEIPAHGQGAPEFEIKDTANKLIGRLTVSEGGIRWRGRYDRESPLIKWADLDAILDLAEKAK